MTYNKKLYITIELIELNGKACWQELEGSVYWQEIFGKIVID